MRDLEMRHSLVFRGIGIVRAKANVAMTNLTYNIARLTQIYRYHKDWIIVYIMEFYNIDYQYNYQYITPPSKNIGYLSKVRKSFAKFATTKSH